MPLALGDPYEHMCLPLWLVLGRGYHDRMIDPCVRRGGPTLCHVLEPNGR